MIAKLNFFGYVLASLASVYLYVLSVSPAFLERKFAETAYARCARFRVASMVCMTIAFVNFILCRKYPVIRCFPAKFGWPAHLFISFALIFAFTALALIICIDRRDGNNK